jgi:putative exosortase-associated protein (TIGR04073 family)
MSGSAAVRCSSGWSKRSADERGAAAGIPLGFAKGLGMIVPRVLVGVWEFVSAPFPVPAGCQPILEPEYPWSYFETRGTRRPA